MPNVGDILYLKHDILLYQGKLKAGAKAMVVYVDKYGNIYFRISNESLLSNFECELHDGLLEMTNHVITKSIYDLYIDWTENKDDIE